jgi:uncharacterized protein
MRRQTALAIAVALTGPIAVRAQNVPAPPPGMEIYYLGLLNRGPAWTREETPETRRIQEGHMANINRMADLGGLVAAGPIEGDHDLRGIFIFRVKTAADARILAAADPAIKAGRLTLELHPWWGPAGIGARFAAERKADPTMKVKMLTYQLGLLKAAPGALPSTPYAERAHLQYIAGMQAAGKLAAVGPTPEDGALQGIFVFKTDAAEAERLVSEDPHVKDGRLVVELYPWWCADHVMPDALPPVPVPK